MTPLQKRRLKRKLQRFWKEWGVTSEELEMALEGLFVILFPFLFRIFLVFFGI